MKRAPLVCALASAILCSAATASAEVGLRGWGPRVGLSVDPDQVVAGAHFDLGEFAQHWRFQPSFDLGFGDDVFALAGNAMAAYYFPIKSELTPYAGGQLTVVWFDFDETDDSETELGLGAVGGIELPLKNGNRFLTELQIGIGDVPDFKLFAGWTF